MGVGGVFVFEAELLHNAGKMVSFTVQGQTTQQGADKGEPWTLDFMSVGGG